MFFKPKNNIQNDLNNMNLNNKYIYFRIFNNIF